MFFEKKDPKNDNSPKCKVNTMACYMSFGPKKELNHDINYSLKTIMPHGTIMSFTTT
jgi:hypothetical protein